MEEISLMRHHAGGNMVEESSRRNHGGDIFDEESLRRNHVGGIIEEECMFEALIRHGNSTPGGTRTSGYIDGHAPGGLSGS